MNILYGVVGEGMGHAMRSRVVLERLVKQGHDVEIMASGRATDYLAKRFDGVNRIHGLHMIAEENRVRLGKTLWSNVLTGAAGVPKNIAAYFSLIKDFKPKLVISDFESWTYLFARTQRIPVVSIDNMQVLNRCVHEKDIIDADAPAFHAARGFVKGKLPFCDEYFITTFFRPADSQAEHDARRADLRPEILSANVRSGSHLLVYQTSEGHDTLSDTLAKTGIECRIYGMRRGIKEEQREGNLRYMPFSEDVFIDDLASSRAVIAGGGFTLMGEAVYMRKPMLSVPMELQFEQTLNAMYLQKLGYGAFAETLDDPGAVTRFLDIVPACEKALSSYTQEGNEELFRALEPVFDRAEAGVL